MNLQCAGVLRAVCGESTVSTVRGIRGRVPQGSRVDTRDRSPLGYSNGTAHGQQTSEKTAATTIVIGTERNTPMYGRGPALWRNPELGDPLVQISTTTLSMHAIYQHRPPNDRNCLEV